MTTSRQLQDRINHVAAAQHGVVTRTQLREEGLPFHSIDRLLEVGQLRALHRGVYLVGPLLSPRTHLAAAVLACVGSTRVSHRSAAIAWGIWPRPGELLPVEVTITGGRGPRRAGIHVHRVRGVLDPDTVSLDGIRVATVERTLIDLASTAGARDLERSLAQALKRGLAGRSELRSALERHARRRGTERLRSLLEVGEPALTRSEAEELFLEMVRKAGLPRPAANVSVCGVEVDFFWRAHRLIVEIDGFAYHSSAEMFESDRRRDALLIASGYRVMRVTWRHLTKEREALLVLLAQALSRE